MWCAYEHYIYSIKVCLVTTNCSEGVLIVQKKSHKGVQYIPITTVYSKVCWIVLLASMTLPVELSCMRPSVIQSER